MLVQFSLENFACFSQENRFSMVASADLEHKSHLVHSDARQNTDLLRTAALYGANAHGKTKLVEALRFCQSLIVHGTRSGHSIRTTPFRLDRLRQSQPSRFEFVIHYRSVEYTYGFLLDSERVHEEWLFARPNVQEVKYFERVTDGDGKVVIETGASFTGRGRKDQQFIEFVAKGTRPNQLFLTEAADRNVEKVSPLYLWFKEVLTIISATARIQPIEVRSNREQDFVRFIGSFLNKAGTGIDEVVTEEEELDFDKHMPDIPDGLRDKIESDIRKGAIINFMTEEGSSFSLYSDSTGRPVCVRLKTVHKGQDGLRVRFDFEEESAGTQRLMDILPILADVTESEKVVVIDELDRKLHPLLSRLFVESYLQRCNDSQRGQLIFTTHDTHLLDLSLLRRDEVWFLQKNSVGETSLYSLSDLKVRPDLKIEKGYLNGRFGGIPVIKQDDDGSLVCH